MEIRILNKQGELTRHPISERPAKWAIEIPVWLHSWFNNVIDGLDVVESRKHIVAKLAELSKDPLLQKEADRMRQVQNISINYRGTWSVEKV